MNEHERSEAARAQLAVREAVAARTHARPGPAFRARLKDEFVSGNFRAPRVPAPSPWFRQPVWIARVAAAAAVALVVFMNRGPDWRVVAASGEGRITVGNASFAPAEQQRIAAALRRGGKVSTEGAVTLDLVAQGVLAVTLGPDTRVTLRDTPGRWWGRDAQVHVAAGNAYFSTGRGFRGAHLAVSTPELQVDAVGTSFAVLRGEDGSCVCVMEGHVHVARHGGAAEDVPEGMRRLVGVDGREQTLPILEDSVHRLHEQLSGSGGALGR